MSETTHWADHVETKRKKKRWGEEVGGDYLNKDLNLEPEDPE